MAEKRANDSPPKSKLGVAMAYSLNHWENLTRFLVDGDLERSNNRAERGIKQFVMGRKNDLFSDSVRGGAIPVESSLAS
ncbi:hypothetical protein ABB02_00101 [Clostridiaceae bacterium JG1575]|nr:hypothetical protein ABB02_00101 [Clostridiaceae bacterium JG1575]